MANTRMATYIDTYIHAIYIPIDACLLDRSSYLSTVDILPVLKSRPLGNLHGQPLYKTGPLTSVQHHDKPF